MAELRINLDDPFHQMLESLKPLAESVIEDELDFDTFVNVVLWRGMRGMIEDIVPGDPEILMNSMVLMFEQNPEFVASFINNMLKAGAPPEQAKERLGFIRERLG